MIASAPTRKQERALAPHPSLSSRRRSCERSSGPCCPLGEGTVLDPFAGAGSMLAAGSARLRQHRDREGPALFRYGANGDSEATHDEAQLALLCRSVLAQLETRAMRVAVRVEVRREHSCGIDDTCAKPKISVNAIGALMSGSMALSVM